MEEAYKPTFEPDETSLDIKPSSRITFDSNYQPDGIPAFPAKKRTHKKDDYSSKATKYFNSCNEFLDIVSLAEKFVDSTIEEAQNVIERTSVIDQCDPSFQECSLPLIPLHREYSLIDYKRPQFTSWPDIEHFTVNLGAAKINEYLTSFNTEEEWLYAIYYLGSNNRKYETLYNYKASWSLPTARYPIPQAVAHVFFTIEVSKLLPPNCLVDV